MISGWSPLLPWLAGHMPGLSFLGSVPTWLLETVYAVGGLGLLYPAFYLLLRVRWINRFFAVTTFTHIYRRYHEPGTAFRDLEV